MARQPVKITYARKRVRAKATAKLTSSPLEVLSPHRDDITRSEMSRRMLKRSRRISHEDDDQIRINARAVKRARCTLQAPEPDPLPTGADINVFQTPFPSTEYIHPSSLTCPLLPEHISPVPHAKQIFSLLSSRNLKENSTSIPLASPFHSRPSSPHSPPTSKAKLPLYRLPLHSKSRTLPGALQKDNIYDHRLPSRKDSVISLNDRKLPRQLSLNDSRLSRNDALKQLARNPPFEYQRHTSSLNPSYMLSLHAGSCGPDPQLLIRPSTSGNSSTSPFLLGRPQFFSTPQRHFSSSQTGLQASVSPSCLAFRTYFPHDVRDEDIEMAHRAELPKIPKVHIPRNSIISSSGSFTLATRLISNAPGVANEHNTNVSTGSAPMSISTDVLPGPQKFSMGNYMVPLVSPLSPALDVVNSGPHCRISISKNIIPLSGTSPLASPAPADDSTHTAIGKQRLVFPTSSPAPHSLVCTAINAGEYIPNTPPPLSPTRHGGSASTSGVCAASQADLIQDMLALGLGGGNHDTGVQDTRLPMRTRSLHSPPGISSKKKSTAKHKRNRAGTIRASDFVRPATSGTSSPLLTSLASTIVGPANSLPGRTRSGTLVGPNSKLAVQSRSNSVVKRQPVVQVTQCDAGSGSADGLAICKEHEGQGPWTTEDLNYVGLAHRGKIKKGKRRRGKEKVMHDDITSDDPLLIVGPWRDEDWS